MTEDNLLWLAQKIVSAYESYGFVSAVIFGKQGSGKTTYAFKVMRDVYYYLNKYESREDAWADVERSYFFELPEALDKIEMAIRNNLRIPVILFDDASIWLSKYEWYKDYMKVFYKIYALARLRITAILFTTPSPDDLAFFLREKGWYQIRVRWVNKKKKYAEAMLYSKSFARNSKGEIVTKVKAQAIDMFKVDLPNDFYQRYLEKRRQTEERLIDEITRELEKERESDDNFRFDNGV